MSKRLILCFSLCATIGSIHAQGFCPPGQYPVAGQGWHYCAGVPGASETTTTNTPQPVRWQNNWVVLAIDLPKGVLGRAQSTVSADSAKQLAMADCSAKGGTQCAPEVSVENGCVAMTVGSSKMNTSGAGSELDAERKSLEECNAVDTGCKVYHSECALPTRLP